MTLIITAIIICIGLSRIGNAIDSLTQAIKDIDYDN